jgi:hypothetical protein
MRKGPSSNLDSVLSNNVSVCSLVKVQDEVSHTHTHTRARARIHTHTHTHIYIYLFKLISIHPIQVHTMGMERYKVTDKIVTLGSHRNASSKNRLFIYQLCL